MRIKEITEGASDQAVMIEIETQIRNTSKILSNFEVFVEANGWTSTEEYVNAFLNGCQSIDWYFDCASKISKKTQLTYVKVKLIRSQLEQKMRSGV